MSVGLLRAAGVLLLILCGQATAVVRTSGALGAAYDTNPFEQVGGGNGSVITSLQLMLASPLQVRPGTRLTFGYEAGIRRPWQEAPESRGLGDVVVNRLTIGGRHRLGKRLALSGSSAAKIKTVHRHPGEESYLRGEAALRLDTGAGLFGGGAGIRLSDDDARDPKLAEARLGALDLELRWRPARRLLARVDYTRRRLRFDREALDRAPGETPLETGRPQSDLTHAFGAALDLYQGGLLQVRYGYLKNRSNSYGYGFRAHRFRLQAALSLGAGLDGMVLAIRQFRSYDDPLDPFSRTPSSADDYEQTTFVTQVTRPLGPGLAASLRYTLLRNGAGLSGDRYRKHVWGLFLEFGGPMSGDTSASLLP